MSLHESVIDEICRIKGYQRSGIHNHMRDTLDCPEAEGISSARLPDYWGFDAKNKSYIWGEVVASNDISDGKMRYLYWLQDIVDGSSYKIQFEKIDLTTSQVIDFNPYLHAYSSAEMGRGFVTYILPRLAEAQADDDYAVRLKG